MDRAACTRSQAQPTFATLARREIDRSFSRLPFAPEQQVCAQEWEASKFIRMLSWW